MQEDRTLPAARPDASGSGADELNQARAAAPPSGTMHPGDQVPPGTFGSGQNTCRDCFGNGALDSGRECAACGGSGQVLEAIGGGG